MPLNISRSRLRRVVRIRNRKAAREEKTPFRNGTLLACFYMALSALFAVWAAHFVRKSFIVASSPHEASLYLGVDAVVIGASLFSGRMLLSIFEPKVLQRNSRLLMLLLVALLSHLLSVALVWGTARIPAPLRPADLSATLAFALPYLFAPVLATLLAGPGAGIALGVPLAMQSLLFVRHDCAWTALLTGTVVAIVAPLFTARIHRRGKLVRTCLAVGTLQLLGVFSDIIAKVAELKDYSRADFLSVADQLGGEVFLSVVAVAASIFAVLALLPFLEHVFAACSDIRLNGFADLGHPLLSRLALEAPGTYHHSIVVATLAADAAERIGANPLLCRVGAYYHDIGKLANPSAFTENAGGGPTVHDTLPPTMSAIVLASHVKDGVGFANDYNLPRPVRRIIEEHHGTTVMAFFLDKAQRQAEARAAKTGAAPETVDANQFRYAGPRPTFVESAIISLADSVEAASRSLPKPIPSMIEKLVDHIVDGKVQDGQLNDAPVTCKDVAEIKRCFTAALATIRHARIPYPKPADPAKAGDEAPAEPPAREENHDGGDPARPAPAQPRP